MQIEIEDMKPLRVGTVRHVGPYHEIGKAFQQLADVAGAAGLFQAPGALMLGIYYDDPRSTAPEQLRADAAITIAEPARVPNGLTEQVVPGGRYARATHIGSYEGLPNAWGQFGASLGARGYRLRPGPGLEVYRSDMARTPPEELRTDLYMPVE